MLPSFFGNETVEVLPDDTKENVDLSFKIIILGDSGVGKSCFTIRGTKNIYKEEQGQVTLGFSFQSIILKINDKIVKLQIWDTCGQEKFKSLVTNFFRNSSLAIVMYAINDYTTFENVRKWLHEVKSKSNPNVKIFLIGNKSDLEKERTVATAEGERLKLEEHFELFFETSALTGDNVQNVFIEAGKTLLNEYTNFRTSIDYSNRISLGDSYKSIGNNNVNIPRPPASDEQPKTKRSNCCP